MEFLYEWPNIYPTVSKIVGSVKLLDSRNLLFANRFFLFFPLAGVPIEPRVREHVDVQRVQLQHFSAARVSHLLPL